MTFTDAEWFERAEYLRSGAATLDGMAAESRVPLSLTDRDSLQRIASILRREADRIVRLERVTP